MRGCDADLEKELFACCGQREVAGVRGGREQGGFEGQRAGVGWLEAPQLQAQAAGSVLHRWLKRVADEVVPVPAKADDDALCVCL